MRCYACNNILMTQEATRKFSESGSYTELCNKCLDAIGDDSIETEDGLYEGEQDDEAE